MRKPSRCFILLLVFLVSCSPARRAPGVMPTTSALPAIEATSTPVPGSVLTPTASPAFAPTAESTSSTLPAPDLHEARMEEIRMMDATSGWAWASDRANVSYLLHTSDGGQTWQDVTPQKGLQRNLYGYSDYELDARTAWMLLGGEKLLRTSDGGQTWDVINQNLRAELVWPYPDWYTLHFIDANHGWLRGDITAAGARVLFYETQDGGVTWNPSDFKTLPDGYRHPNAMNEIAFWVPTDVVYYDRERSIIAPGEQEGMLEMFLSTDRGNSWTTVRLPSSTPPEGSFNVYDRKIHSPVFFDQQNGILAVTIYDGNANTTRLSVYGTSDGGLTWSLLGGPATLEDTIVEARSEVLFLSARDAVLLCGINLCVTHDSGKNWQTLDFGISIPADKEHISLQLDFIDTDTGWFLLKTVQSSFHLLKTTDGGVTWTELSPVVNP